MHREEGRDTEEREGWRRREGDKSQAGNCHRLVRGPKKRAPKCRTTNQPLARIGAARRASNAPPLAIPPPIRHFACWTVPYLRMYLPVFIIEAQPCPAAWPQGPRFHPTDPDSQSDAIPAALAGRTCSPAR